MCLGIPGRIIDIKGVMARVDVAGTKKEISLELMKEASIGDYVIVHAGFAIEKVDTVKAEETLSMIDEAIKKR